MFEVKYKDMLGRIGRFKTRSGTLETPTFLPVINPRKVIVSPRELHDAMQFDALMTNSYILYQVYGQDTAIDLHRLYNFPGIIFTDSGGFQILMYGKVDVTPTDVIEFQEKIGTDVGTILDIPTGYTHVRAEAEYTAKETVARARQACATIKNWEVSWMGPIQGGVFQDIVKWSAEQMAEMPFSIFALGSPVELMENYRFTELIDMMVTAKLTSDVSKPIHLFGAGHPMLFALAVALGYDTFDSASYALFAREGRYMTVRGTYKLSRLSYLPCSCPVCCSITPIEMSELSPVERERELALHNLYAIRGELEEIKQAIREGRLWDLVENRVRGNPSLMAAFARMSNYTQQMEPFSPATKERAIYLFDDVSLRRPEIVSFRRKIKAYIFGLTDKDLVVVPIDPRLGTSKAMEITRDTFLKCTRNGELLLLFKPPLGAVPWHVFGSYPNDRTIWPVNPMLAKKFQRENIAQLIDVLKEYKGGIRITCVTEGNFERKAERLLRKVLQSSSEMSV